MKSGLLLVSTISIGGILLASASPARARTEVTPANTIPAPDYGTGPVGSPTADARPGEYFFGLGTQAVEQHDYLHAVEMFKVAASWAYKPAEYDLGLMYFRGEGVSVDRARGTAWTILAAERGTPLYAEARDLMVTALTDEEFQRADNIWNELKLTYGDAVALKRAKFRWVWVRTHMTGSRTGSAMGELKVYLHSPTGDTSAPMVGSSAYAQFRASDNPYSPVFLQQDRKGTVTIEPLHTVGPGDSGKPSGQPAAQQSATEQPPAST